MPIIHNAILIPSLLQHKKHSSPEVDDEKLRAAKAFLEQHLKQAAGGDAAAGAAAAAGSKERSKDRSKEKKEKVAGSLPPGVPLLTADDYFERAAEFTAWLQEIKHQYFNGECCQGRPDAPGGAEPA
jgi:hypothetical protein